MVNKQEFLDTYSYFDKDVLIEIIDIFLNEYAAKIDKLYKAIESRNFNDLRFDAHSLKGVVATFCALPAKERAYDLEKTGASLIQSNGEGFNKEELIAKVDELKSFVYTMAEELTEMKLSLQPAT